MHRAAKQIHRAIQSANNIFLVPHKRPDGDALGSMAAFMQYLRSIDKNHCAFSSTKIMPSVRFLPHINYITNDASVWKKLNPDLIIVFDSGNLNHAGIAEHINNLHSKPIIINIDHHHDNEFYGHHNMVMPDASSTGEVLYYFFKYNNIPIAADMATCLLTGLITDTDNFTNAATSKKSMSIASELIIQGGDTKLIQGQIFKNKSINTLKLWGAALSRLTKHETLNIVYTYITQKDIKEYNAAENDTDGISNLMNILKDGIAALVIRELPDGSIKGSFRTTHDNINVSAWAKELGGGGHKKAAGFTISMPMKDALNMIFNVIKNSAADKKQNKILRQNKNK